MLKVRLAAVFILIAGSLIGYFIFASEKEGGRFSFRLGLDLAGGTHLIYKADVSELSKEDAPDALDSLRDVIERRVNLFGVAEPLVQVEKSGLFLEEGKEGRLIVELPGVTDVDRAVKLIGETPLLEFRLERPNSVEKERLLEELKEFQEKIARGENLEEEDLPDANALFVKTDLTGRFLEKATLAFDSTTGAPKILLDFNEEGGALFGAITGKNVGKILAIYLDGVSISQPIIQQEIRGGRAEITGTFTPQEAKILIGRLNSGALPIPIELLETQTVGASLGEVAFKDGVRAALMGFALVALFMIVWYRLPGLVSVVALGIYSAMMLVLFKLVPVTLTAAGIAGLILSIGMAVDANILIFERTKEELSRSASLLDAITQGFSRAWLAIRDSNTSSIMTAVILFWFGTSLIEGFALVFALGVFVSMITAISVSRTLLLAVSFERAPWLFRSGMR